MKTKEKKPRTAQEILADLESFKRGFMKGIKAKLVKGTK
jgi:hypothetical protein